MKVVWITIMMCLCLNGVWAKEYHVAISGSDANPGSKKLPFRTIQAAALQAHPGDVITVHEGIYREWINPPRGGTSDAERIVYRAAEGEKVEIKGSEVITGWKKVEKGVWKVKIPNAFFGDYNPYRELIQGDWFWDKGRIHHTGEVFVNERSLYEKVTLDEVIHPLADTAIIDTEGSTYTWYCESDDSQTTIWANFQVYNPNKELVEISTRKTCFYPENPGVDYITIQGFHFSQAATQWGAPTAEQIGMIATHWNKGWIIENNIIHDSKCSGITLGKERETGHNVWSADKSMDGSLHYIEVTFRTLRNGWSKKNIGAHIVRNNEIYNCEQTGICGSMGGAFSVIENNHIHHIWTKRQFTGAEIGGIKLHAAIDAEINRNRIHDCGRGLWLDWMSQGVRVSGNLLYRNDTDDLFLEVNHGPILVDNNLLLSDRSIRNQSQGTAFVHNLIAGQILMWSEPHRFTPYHLPHSTEIKGLSTIYSGDDRYFNNIFVGGHQDLNTNPSFNYGTKGYAKAVLPVWIEGNAYYLGLEHYPGEANFIESLDFNPELELIEDGNQVYLSFTCDEALLTQQNQMITTNLLGQAKMPAQSFEASDGSGIEIDTDYFQDRRKLENPTAGPFENVKPCKVKLRIWKGR